MVAWCAAFIAAGFWKAILFIFGFGLIGYVLSLLFKKLPLFSTIVAYGFGTAAWFIVYNIRGGVGWLIFGILALLGFLWALYVIIKFRR